MLKRLLIFGLNVLLCCGYVSAQEIQKSELQQQAEEEVTKGQVAKARSLYIRAFDSYANQGQYRKSVECGVKATALYYKESLYKEAFEFLHRVDQVANSEQDQAKKAALRYLASKERMQMYMRLSKGASAKEHLNNMEVFAKTSNEPDLQDDLLYNQAIYYYTFGEVSKGNAVFKEMADRLTNTKEYDKVDEVYKSLIANGRRSNNANMVAQSYSSYIAWKDSVSELKRADEIGALKKQIAANEASIEEKDSSLSTRQMIIIGLCVLVAILAGVLIIGGIILLRFIMVNRKQKKTIKLANETNALKAKFISNISAQLDPTLKKLDGRNPEVQALMDFSKHIQTLSQLENSQEPVELEETQIPPFCEALMNQIRGKVDPSVTLTVNAPKMSAMINKDYVSHVLSHLLNNAAEYTAAGGHIWLEYKKRGAHTHQFIVSNTGESIPEEQRENFFKPFLEIKDLTKGDGLGLPICKQMAINMNGDLNLDPAFTKGTRFVMDLHG